MNCNARILLAEDNITNQQVATRLLKKLGLKADAVANGIEAIKALEMIDYDLVLMDVQMPEMDGLEATRKIRDRHSAVRRHDIPIIAMTANAMQGDREKCLDVGMNDYLAKPVNPRALEEVLTQWLGQTPEVFTHEVGVSEAYENSRTSLSSGTPENKGPDALDSSCGTADVCFDTTALVERCMGDILLAEEILNIFVGDMPQQIRTLRQCLANADLEGVTRQAHTIKGAAANIGLETMRSIASKIELAGRRNCLASTEVLMPELEKAFMQFKETLDSVLAARHT